MSYNIKMSDYHITPEEEGQTGRQKARILIHQEIAKKYYAMYLSEGKYTIHKSFDTEHFKEMYKAVNDPKQTYLKLSKVLLTINPPGDEGATWDQLKELWTGLINAKNILFDAQMVLEQRSMDPTDPRGWHMHIATKNRKGKARSQFIQSVYYYYKKIIGTHGSNVIHFCKKRDAYEYVNGLKFGEKKNKKMQCDIILREKLSFDNIYNQCPLIEKKDMPSTKDEEKQQPEEQSTAPPDTNSTKM